MGSGRSWLRASVAVALAVPLSAHANPMAPDRLTIAAGALVVPDYEGSDDYTITPAAGALARWHGHNISLHGTALSIDLVPERDGRTFKWIVAPLASLNFDRVSTPSDPVVGLIRKRKLELELGGTVGFTKTGVLTSAYDTLTVQISGSHDVGAVSKSFIITPTVQYVMPLSKAAVVGASLSADVVGGRYARYYFGIGPISSGLSGLPQYRPSGGLKSITAGLMGAVSLHGDITRGLAVGGLINFERLVGDFAATPLVATRGSANQFIAAIGLGYTF